MDFIKYKNIKRLKDNFLAGFKKGDIIVIEEKIDGANFSIRYDKDTDSVAAFSSKQQLSAGEFGLRGAYLWSQRLSVDKVKWVLGDRYIAYGEWLIPHTLEYPKDKYREVYFFDVYDIEKGVYLGVKEAKAMIDRLGLKFVPIFYVGEFISWEHIYSFLGKTMLGGESGEGIVVKNISRLDAPEDAKPYFVKIVCDQFCEVHKTKKHDTTGINKRIEMQNIVSSVVTEARVAKLINKMIDEGVLPENYGEPEMAIINKRIVGDVYKDCLKEEPDVVNSVGKLFGAIASTVAKEHVQNIVLNKKED